MRRNTGIELINRLIYLIPLVLVIGMMVVAGVEMGFEI